MASTTNYSWSTPDDTALVKDGASAIRTLGSSVDTTLFTALGGAYPGLRLVKKQTIGSGVSSVTVTGAFSATYTNYKVIVSGGTASAQTYMTIKFGATTTGYYDARPRINIVTGAQSTFTNNNTSPYIFFGICRTNGQAVNADINSPFLTTPTTTQSPILSFVASDYDATYGFLDNTTSYTEFTLATTGGATLTGGTIYVYGYGIS
jgi:hypothetical protein